MWPHRALMAEQLEAAPECLLSVACHSWWIPESITRYGVTAKFCDTIRAAFVPVGEKYLGQIFPRLSPLQVLVWSLQKMVGHCALNIKVISIAVN